MLTRDNDDNDDNPDNADAETAARLFRAACKTASRICAAEVVPVPFTNQTSVSTLTALDLGRAAGIDKRPKLLCFGAVHDILFAAAQGAKLRKLAHKRSFLPDFSHMPRPLWSGPGRRKIIGKF